MRTVARVAIALCSSSAFAGVADGPFTYINTDAAALSAAGFANLTPDGPLQSAPTGTCAGCYTMPTIYGPLQPRSFFQFEVVGGMPTVNDGAYAVMRFNFTDPNFGVNEFINIVNNSSAQAFGIGYNPNPTCSFQDFLDPSLFNSTNTVIFRWDASPGQSLFTFGFDFTSGGYTTMFPGMTVLSASALPAPGAMAMLGAAGLMGSRRRR